MRQMFFREGRVISFKVVNIRDCLTGKTCRVVYSDGSVIEYVNVLQFANHLFGLPFRFLPGPKPHSTVDVLRARVAAAPADFEARLALGAQLVGSGTIEEGYAEYQEAIRLLSDEEVAGDRARRIAARAFARYAAARAMEDLGRHAVAQQQWQACAEDWQLAVPDASMLSMNPQYLEAIAKSQS